MFGGVGILSFANAMLEFAANSVLHIYIGYSFVSLCCMKTEHLLRVALTHIFLVLHTRDSHIINAHALAQEMRIVSPRAHQKSLVGLMFRRTRLEVPDPFPSFCSTPHPTQSSMLMTEMSMNPCASPPGGVLFGRIAEQSPLTGYEPKSRIEVSSEHTPIYFTSRKNSFNTDFTSKITGTIEAGQFTSPLFTQEVEVQTLPFL